MNPERLMNQQGLPSTILKHMSQALVFADFSQLGCWSIYKKVLISVIVNLLWSSIWLTAPISPIGGARDTSFWNQWSFAMHHPSWISLEERSTSSWAFPKFIFQPFPWTKQHGTTQPLRHAIIADSIGFIQHLPHSLFAAFQASRVVSRGLQRSNLHVIRLVDWWVFQPWFNINYTWLTNGCMYTGWCWLTRLNNWNLMVD